MLGAHFTLMMSQLQKFRKKIVTVKPLVMMGRKVMRTTKYLLEG
jgi:hypothetical protein